MALDGIFLSLVKKELMPLIGGRVDKIYQPSHDELIVSFRTFSGSCRVLMNASAGDARIHITKTQPENPKTPPMFCMLMRKKLVSGKLIDIRQDGLERILYLDFDCVNELGDKCRFTLACEIMGRCSNIILIDGDHRIVDCIRRVTPDLSSVRPVLPNMEYSPPPRRQRLSIFSFSREEAEKSLKGPASGKPLSKGLVDAFEGVSPLFAREAEHYCARGRQVGCSEIDGDMLDRLCFYLNKTAGELERGENRFTVIKTRDGALKDYCFTSIAQYGNLMVTSERAGACETLDEFYRERDCEARRRQKAADIFRVLSSATDKTARRVAVQKEELGRCAERDSLRICGDLIMSNLYRIEKGMTKVQAENLFQPESGMLTIKLDPRLTPVQNAQRYYAEYRKADTAERKLTELIADGEQELLYLDSVFDSLTRASDEEEIASLREELSEQGYIRKRPKVKTVTSVKPLHFVSDEGFDIFVGRNNRQNDRLTTKDSDKNDIWLHTHNIAGAHVVIACKGRTPGIKTVEQAARLAALHSKAKSSSQVPVDYTAVKNVRKPAGARPGMVIFTANKTLYVTPDQKEADALYAGTLAYRG